MQNKSLGLLILLIVFSYFCSAQPQNIRYEDFGNISSVSRADQSKWNQLRTGFGFSQADLNSRITYNNYPILNADRTVNVSGWRGEYVYAQVVVSAKRDVGSLTVTVSNLVSNNGNKIIDGRHCNAGFVYFVLADNSRGVCYKKENVGYNELIVPDIIDFKSPSSFVKANTNRPVWLRIKIPRETEPGTYRGKINATCDGQTQSLDIVLRVSGNMMPPASEKKFFLELWQYPIAEADFYKVKPWSEEHFRLMKPAMENLKDAGEDVITASFFWDAFNPSARSADELMMKVTKTRSGNWTYDFTNFDKWVSFMMGIGIDKQITCFGMAPLNYKYYYFDEATNQVTFFQQGVNGAQYKQFWTSFLKAFQQHLEQKGWFDKTTIGFSEKNPDVLIPLINFIKGVNKNWKISYSGKYQPEIQKDIYDYSLISNQEVPENVIMERRRKGFITTFYTSCWERFPNTFVMSDPTDATWLSWNAAKRQMDGYLRYAYDYWTASNVLSDVRSNIASGDRFLIYPYGNSSIRFEMLKDGIEDYEKICLKFPGTVGRNPNNSLSANSQNARFRSLLSDFDFKKVSSDRPRSQQIEQARSLLE